MYTKRNLVCGLLAVSILLLAAVPSWAGLVSKWPGDGHANDIVGENDGTLKYGAAYAPGKIGQAFLFDGIDDCVWVPSSTSLDITEAITIEAWIYPTEIKTQEIVRRSSGVPSPYSLALSETGTLPDVGDFVFSLNINENLMQCRKADYPINTWTHVAGTFDGSTMKLYVNGTLEDSLTEPGELSTAVGSLLLIGTRMSLPADTFKGMIDEVAIYNCALDADEIRAIFLANAAEAATEVLIEDIEEMGLPEGIENSLVSKLENAIKSMDKGQDNAAAKQLKAFIKQVKAQSGKKIPKVDADALIAAAQEIIDLL